MYAFQPRRAAIAAALAALMASPLAAQQTAAPPAAAAQFTPGHVALAREVVTAAGIGRSFESVAPQLAQSLGTTVTRTRPEVAKDFGEVLLALRPEFDARRDEMLDTSARIFAARLSEAELRDVAAFFKSPIGQRYVAAQPAILGEMFAEMQGWTERVEQFVLTRVREEMQKRGHSF